MVDLIFRGVEISAATTAFVATYFSTQGRMVQWPLTLVAFTLYALIFYHVGLFASSVVQCVSMVFAIQGWRAWSRASDSLSSIRWASVRECCVLAVMMFAVGLILFYGLSLLGYGLKGMDLIASTLLFGGLYCLGRRWLQVWFIFFAVDLSYLFLAFEHALYFSAAKYACYLFLAVLGYRRWHAFSRDQALLPV